MVRHLTSPKPLHMACWGGKGGLNRCTRCTTGPTGTLLLPTEDQTHTQPVPKYMLSRWQCTSTSTRLRQALPWHSSHNLKDEPRPTHLAVPSPPQFTSESGFRRPSLGRGKRGISLCLSGTGVDGYVLGEARVEEVARPYIEM